MRNIYDTFTILSAKNYHMILFSQGKQL